MLDHLHVCIMAGGSGERFWPLSRATRPKHLLKLLSQRTLLEETVKRVEGMIPYERIFVVTNQSQLPVIQEELPLLDPQQIVAEPVRRDTAPAAALATALALRNDPEAIVAILASDAWIQNESVFQKQLRDAAEIAAQTGALTTIAIPPTYAATGYGYLRKGKSLGKGTWGSERFEVAEFVEKPNLPMADKYFKSGQYFWNAGIFVWKARHFLTEAEILFPELGEFILKATATEDLDQFLKDNFEKLPKISVDYGIMEKAPSVVAIEAQFDWDDVGSWTALPRHFKADEQHNTIIGKGTMVDASNNIVFSNNRVVALCGVKDLVVVETEDAILVCHRDAVESIKKLQPSLSPELR